MKPSEIKPGGVYVGKTEMSVRDVLDVTDHLATYRDYDLENGRYFRTGACSDSALARWANRCATLDEVARLQRSEAVQQETAPTKAEAMPPVDDVRLAKASSRRLAPFRNRNLKVSIDETEERIELPATAVRLLVDFLSAMAEGNAMALIPIPAELTTQRAADLLGVSHPFLVRQMEEGLIPYRMIGKHRRVLFSDLMRYKQEIDRKRHETLDELTVQAQELGMGYESLE